jgi:hypothetical protein
MTLYYVYLACLLFSAIMALVSGNALKSRRLFLFIPYLFLLFIQETFVFFYTQQSPEASTAIVYNIYKPATTLFFAILYYRIPFNAPVRRLIIGMLTVYFLIAIVTFCFIQSIKVYNSYLSRREHRDHLSGNIFLI